MSYDELIDYVLQTVPLATRTSVMERLRRAAIELCKEADVLLAKTTVEVPAGELEIGLPELDPGLTAVRLVKITDPPLCPNSDYRQLPFGIIELFKASEEARTLSVVVAAHPSENSTTLPDELARYREALFAGALWHLLTQFGQPYYNPELARIRHSEFWGHVGDAKRMADRGHHRANRTSRYRNFL